MRKKWIVSTVLILVLSTLLAACSGSEGGDNNDSNSNNNSNRNESNNQAGENTPTDQKIKISIWHNYSGEDARAVAIRSQIEKFANEHPEVELDQQAIPPDGYRERLKTVAAGNELPDVFFAHAGALMKEFYDNGFIQPIDPVLEKYPEWAGNFTNGAFAPLSFDGEIYATPINASVTSLFFYNKALFEEHHVKVPETWDELLAAIDAFNAVGITPIALGNKAAWLAQSSILGAVADRVTGTEWFLKAANQDGAKFTDPEFIEVLEYMQSLSNANAFQQGFNSIDNTQMEQYFIQGNAAMMIDGSWGITNMASTATEEELAQIEVAVIPAIPGGRGDQNTITGGPGGGFVLNKNVEGKKRDLAFELLYAVGGPDSMKAVAESNSIVNYKVDIDESKVSSLYMKTYRLTQNVTFVPVYDAVLTSAGADAINKGLQELFMGGNPADIAQKLQDAQARALAN